jgi:hypothetical protein
LFVCTPPQQKTRVSATFVFAPSFVAKIKFWFAAPPTSSLFKWAVNTHFIDQSFHCRTKGFVCVFRQQQRNNTAMATEEKVVASTMELDDNEKSLIELSEGDDVDMSHEPSLSEFADRSSDVSPITDEDATETFPQAKDNAELLRKSVSDVRSEEFWKVKIHHLPPDTPMWIWKTGTRTRRFSREFTSKLEYAFLHQSPSFPISAAITVCFNSMSLYLLANQDEPVLGQHCAKLERHSTTWKSVSLIKELPDNTFGEIQKRASELNAAVFRDKHNESGEIIRIHAPESVIGVLEALVCSHNSAVIEQAPTVEPAYEKQAEDLVNRMNGVDH